MRSLGCGTVEKSSVERYTSNTYVEAFLQYIDIYAQYIDIYAG